MVWCRGVSGIVRDVGKTHVVVREDLVDFELVYVAVGPFKCDLQYVVEFLEGKVRGDGEEAVDDGVRGVFQVDEKKVVFLGGELTSFVSTRDKLKGRRTIHSTLEDHERWMT
jgi:hypothetical protein